MCVLLLPLRGGGCMEWWSETCYSEELVSLVFVYRTINVLDTFHTHTQALRTLRFRNRIFCLKGVLGLRRTIILHDMRVNEEASHNERGTNRQYYEHHRGR